MLYTIGTCCVQMQNTELIIAVTVCVGNQNYQQNNIAIAMVIAIVTFAIIIGHTAFLQAGY